MGINFNTIERIVKYAESLGAKHKINFGKLKLTVLKTDVVSLSENITPKKFNSQAERLKHYYNGKGVPFLLPHQEWSNKKILETMDVFDEELKTMAELKKINKQTLQPTIEKLIPESKGKIEINDFDDLKKYLKSCNFSPELVKAYLSWKALAVSDLEKTKIFLNFKGVNGDRNAQLKVKNYIDHEVRHALKHTFQNQDATDIYKSNSYKSVNQGEMFNKIWSNFYNSINNVFTLEATEITEKNMLKWIGSDSIESLHKKFDNVLDNCIENAKTTGQFNLGSDKKGWKHFFNRMKFGATDEKLAYQSNIGYREWVGNLNESTDAELKPLLYAEMEKFFDKKRIEANKLYK